jgi:glycosyltransferase involved in cell wall biosynthesis
MRLLVLADGRSAIALNWISGLLERGHEIHLASSFPCDLELPLASLTVIPLAFSQLKGGRQSQRQPGSLPAVKIQNRRRNLGGAALVGARTVLRQWLGPLTLPSAARRLEDLIRQIQPELVHAMRIPYEGMAAALALQDLSTPLLVSIWGNDFTLHAPSNPWMGSLTRRALTRADALHADCSRDIRLARAWGFRPDLPGIVLPGAGGVQSEIFFPPGGGPVSSVSGEGLLVTNPRGVRAYVQTGAFFEAIPLVLKIFPKTRFACVNMAGESVALRWMSKLGITGSVDLLPGQSRPEMAHLFRRTTVAVSPTTHDGTPNTLLEAMACGCFPVVGDLESLREWITPGINGFLVDPTDPQALAQAICLALESSDMRQRAAQINSKLIAERAAFATVMQKAEEFYKMVIAASEFAKSSG